MTSNRTNSATYSWSRPHYSDNTNEQLVNILSQLANTLIANQTSSLNTNSRGTKAYILNNFSSTDVVATTRHSRTNDLTTSKALQWGYQVKSGGITRELNKEPSLHCSSIYINYMWSMLQQYVYLMSIYHASTSCPLLIHICFP